MFTENESFISFNNAVAGVIFDDSKSKTYPIAYHNVIEGNGITPTANNSYFGYVYSGKLSFSRDGYDNIPLSNGMFFSVSGLFSLKGKGSAVVIEVSDSGNYSKTGYRAYPIFGGRIEEKGRLKYIDGCTDSLLISPVKKGDPCLNHLHFPHNIDQTQHTHPSHRIGIVASGSGECITPFGNMPLTEGMIFVIKEWDGASYSKGIDGKMHPNGQHAFRTFDECMNVIAFHPDSDFGAEDENHPMINRTIVDGVSANQLKDIMTK